MLPSRRGSAARGGGPLPPGTVRVRQAVRFFLPAGARRPCGGTPAARCPLDRSQAGLPRRRRLTASRTQLPTLHQAQAGGKALCVRSRPLALPLLRRACIACKILPGCSAPPHCGQRHALSRMGCGACPGPGMRQGPGGPKARLPERAAR